MNTSAEVRLINSTIQKSVFVCGIFYVVLWCGFMRITQDNFTGIIPSDDTAVTPLVDTCYADLTGGVPPARVRFFSPIYVANGLFLVRFPYAYV